jgi:hypothetical protein
MILTTIVLLAWPAAHLLAQEGPYVPCVGCEDLIYAPYPEPGHWYNPDQSGSGFTLEFQNGIFAGYYFGYDANGEPEWYLMTKTLTRSETPGVMWEVEVKPKRYSGGNCLGCPYQENDGFVRLDPIKIEFLQRAYARVTYPDGSIQYMVPIMYGSSGKAYFSEQTPYVFPAFPFDEGALWSLVFKPNSEGKYEPWTWESIIVHVGEAEGERSFPGSHEGALSYRIGEFTDPPEVLLRFGTIICDLDEVTDEVGCIFEVVNKEDLLDPHEYQIPIGNFTDSRFFGETDNGDTVQGYRLQYD